MVTRRRHRGRLGGPHGDRPDAAHDRKRARIGGSTLRARSRQEKADVAAGVTRPRAAAAGGRPVRVPVADTFPLAEADAAYERFAAGGKLGKVVLVA